MKTIKTNREYTIDEILEGLMTTDLPEPYKYQGKIGGAVVYVPGDGMNDVQVYVKKNKITVVDTPRPEDALKAVGRDIAIEALTGKMSVFFTNNHPNKELEKKIAEECTRLFG